MISQITRQCRRCDTARATCPEKGTALCVQDNPIEPPAGSRLPTVVDSLGNAVQRSTLLLRERTLLVEVTIRSQNRYS